jgi:hypothetical protein
MAIQGQPGQKVSETPNSINKTDMGIYTCNHSYVGGIGRRIAMRPPSEK